MLEADSTEIPDKSVARTSTHTGCMRTWGGKIDVFRALREMEDHVLGRRRGEFSMKIHLTIQDSGLSLGAELGAGQEHA